MTNNISAWSIFKSSVHVYVVFGYDANIHIAYFMEYLYDRSEQ